MGHSLFNSDWENVVDMDRNNLVFESRNQQYGAYVIRREYDRSVIIAFFLASTGMLAAATIPAIINYFSKAEVVSIKADRSIEIIIPPPLEKEKVVVPPAGCKIEKVENTFKSIAFAAPVVEDDKVTEAPIVTQLVENVSSVTSTGNGDSIMIIIPVTADKPAIIGDNDDKPRIYVEEMPSFPGGESELMKFIGSNIRYPEFEKQNRIEGILYMTFVVSKEGRVSDITVARGIKGGKGLEAEARRVLELMPIWKPGKNNGYPVNVQFTLPFSFELN